MGMKARVEKAKFSKPGLKSCNEPRRVRMSSSGSSSMSRKSRSRKASETKEELKSISSIASFTNRRREREYE